MPSLLKLGKEVTANFLTQIAFRKEWLFRGLMFSCKSYLSKEVHSEREPNEQNVLSTATLRIRDLHSAKLYLVVPRGIQKYDGSIFLTRTEHHKPGKRCRHLDGSSQGAEIKDRDRINYKNHSTERLKKIFARSL